MKKNDKEKKNNTIEPDPAQLDIEAKISSLSVESIVKFTEIIWKYVIILIIFTVLVNIPNFLDPPFGIDPLIFLGISLYLDYFAGYVGYKAIIEHEKSGKQTIQN